jgi:hypothetical protein
LGFYGRVVVGLDLLTKLAPKADGAEKYGNCDEERYGIGIFANSLRGWSEAC